MERGIKETMQNKKIIQVEDKVPPRLLVPLSIQHMFAMFGASVLVPFMLGISPAIVLFMNGIGTLLFILITKGKAPAYLGSSFAFIAPATLVIENWGYEYALGGFVVVGAVCWRRSSTNAAPKGSTSCCRLRRWARSWR